MFDVVVGDGANLFVIIVCILAGAGAGIAATDFLKTKEENKDEE